MSEETGAEQSGTATISQDPTAWLHQRLAGEVESPESGQEQQATETQPRDEAEVPSADGSTIWDTPIPEDDPDLGRFFANRPIGELKKSYKELVRKLNDQGRQVHELKTHLAARDAAREELLQLLPEKPKEPAQPRNPYAERGVDLETDIVVNPEKFARATDEILTERAEQIAEAKIRQYDEGRRRAQYEADLEYQRREASFNALEQVRESLGLDREAFAPRVHLIMSDAVMQFGEEALFRPADLLKSAQFVMATQAGTPKPVPTQGNPPGAKRAASVESEGSGPTLSSLERGVAEHWADQIGLDGEAKARYLARVAKRLNGGK